MPLLIMHPRDTCDLCGSRLRGILIGTYRINKHSLVSKRGGLTWLECPECGRTYAQAHPTRVPPQCNHWRLDDESQALVDAARVKKGWA